LPVVVDRVMSAMVQGAAAITAFALGSAIVFPFVKGYHAILHLNFYTHDMSGVAPTDPLTKGGQLHAIIGSLIEIGISVAVVVPLGIGTAVFMTEVGGKFARIVRTVVEAMTALPSIVAGLFIYAVLIIDVHFPKSGFAAAMAMSVMGLPIIARAADVVLRVVPGGLREASLALGSSKWQTVWRVVIPTARPGLATALILSVARMIGETSPVLLTSGTTSYSNVNPIDGLMNSMPLSIYSAARSGEPLSIERGYGLAAVLLGIVLILFVTARVLARQRTSR
jgi:phosphate transport system permease protein